jgi:transcriptional regulator with XRE-family HTH domain
MMKRTKEDFAIARGLLGMSAPEMARALRMGKGSDRTIRRYESGECPVPGPTSVAVEALLTGFRPEGFEEIN